jgi:hypothetical protein
MRIPWGYVHFRVGKAPLTAGVSIKFELVFFGRAYWRFRRKVRQQVKQRKLQEATNGKKA